MIDNHNPVNILEHGKDCFKSIELVDNLKNKITKHNTNSKYPLIIGLFGKYGEGKSTIIQSLKIKLEKENIYFIGIDAWKYDIADIENSLHRIYNLEEDMQSIYGNAKRLFFSFLSIFYKKKDITLGLSKDFLHYQHNIHKDIKDMKLIKKEHKSFNKIIICFENLDRCDIDKKISILSGIHNFKDWFKPSIFLVAIDPHSVDRQNRFFEDLIKKVFTTSVYVYQKTIIDLKKYIDDKKISNILHKEILKECLISIYPITPRDINHIINIFESKRNNKKYFKENTLMAILHSEWRDLYHKISKNPFFVQFFIESARKNISINYYEDLNYTINDTKKLNMLFLTFYNNFGALFNIYDSCQGISPLISVSKKNIGILKSDVKINNLEDILDIIDMQLEAENYFEVQRILKKFTDDIDKVNKFFLKCLPYPKMLSILFTNNDYLYFTKNNFSESDKRHILNISAKNLTTYQNKHLSSFILNIFHIDEIEKFKKEFALLFSGNNELFLAFYAELKNDTKKLAKFIYYTYSDELHSLILKLNIKRQLEFYQYFMIVFLTDQHNNVSDDEYKNINVKLFERFFSDEDFLKHILKNNLIIQYCKILNNINSINDDSYLNSFYIIKKLMEDMDILIEDKAKVYYSFRYKFIDIPNELDNEFAWLLFEISKNEILIKKCDFIFQDYKLMGSDKFVKENLDIIRKSILNIFETLNLSIIQNNIFNALSKYMFEYLEKGDFEILTSKFLENELGIYIMGNDFKNDLYFDFIEHIVVEKSNEKYFLGNVKYLDNLENNIIELVNRKVNLEYIDKLKPKKISIEKLINRLDFSKIDVLLLCDIYKNIKKNEKIDFLLEIDKFLINDNKEKLKKYLIKHLGSKENIAFKSKLINDRIIFHFSSKKEHNIKEFIINIVYFFESDENTFLELVLIIEPNMVEYGIKDKKITEILNSL